MDHFIAFVLSEAESRWFCARHRLSALSLYPLLSYMGLFFFFFLSSFSFLSFDYVRSKTRLCRVNTLCFHEWDRIGQDGMRWVFWRQDELQTSRTMLLSHQEEVEWPYGSRRTGWFFGQTNFQETYRVFYNLMVGEGASMLPEDSFRVLAFGIWWSFVGFSKEIVSDDENGMDYRSIDLRWFYQRWFEFI